MAKKKKQDMTGLAVVALVALYLWTRPKTPAEPVVKEPVGFRYRIL